jgi:gliding motility-associated-like protein
MKRLQPDTIRWSKIQKSYVRGIQSIFLILILLGTYTPNGQAQCTPIANAVPGVTLTYVQGGGTNATGVAYNPIFNVYYAAIAGNPGFPLETFDAAGTPLFQTNTGFDMRGLWWNFNLNQLESNGYNAGGIWSYDLNGTGYALNTGTSVFTGYNQPSVQSVGDYNCVDNEIWYYNAGSIMKRDRATNALIANLPITGLPVGTGNLNNNTVFYTDCQGHEIGILDYVTKRVYFADKTTGAYSGMSQLPAATVTNNAFRASWANNMVWTYNTANRTWSSFSVLTGFNTACSVIACTPPTLVIDDLTDCSPNTVDLNNAVNGASTPGTVTFYATAADATAATNPISNTVAISGVYYIRLEDPTDPTCFSTGSVNVTINPIYNLNENVSVCPNGTVTYPDATTAVITANTSYTSNLTTVAGCDSIIVTNVTLYPISNTVENVSVCPNGTVTYPDATTAVITANTSYTSSLTTVNGCDSIIVTNVTLYPISNTVENVSVCPNGTVTYPDATTAVITANTSYTSNLTTVNGCDSIIVTNVTLYAVSNTSQNISACENSSVTYPDGSTAVITASTSYTSTLTTVNGCDSIIVTNVTMDPIYNINENINACQNSTVTYPDGTTTVIIANTSYTSNLVSAAGCDSIIVTNVTMDLLPNPGTNGTISFCSTDPSSDLFAVLGGSPDVGGIWTPAMVSGTGVFNPAVDPAGTYTYEINSACGIVSAQIDVTVNTTDDATFSYAAASFCENDPNPTPTITGTSGGTFTISGGGVINASTGEIDIAASGTGNFSVTYTTNGSCPDSFVFDVSLLEQSDATITAAGPFCDYDAAVQLIATDPGGTWSGTGVDPTTGIFDPTQADIGINTITYTISGQCGDVQSIQIIVSAAPSITTINDTTINLDASVDLLTTSTGSTYSWSPNIWLDCSDCLSPTATPEETITYIVTTEENGCVATDMVSIFVLYDPVIFVPNIFSPNGDNNNDVLYVRGKGVTSLNFIVYDRWGEKVFESTDLDNGWDGNFRGKKMNPAVFVYYVEAGLNNGTTVTKKGDVTLIR